MYRVTLCHKLTQLKVEVYQPFVLQVTCGTSRSESHSEDSVRTQYGVLTGKITRALEKRRVRLKSVLSVLEVCNESAYQACKNAEDIPDLLYQLHDSRQASMLHTQCLENIMETFKLDECRKDLKKYHETQLLPYVESCEDRELLQKHDQNRSGNNRKAVAFNLGEEWSKLDEANAQQAKKKIAALLGKDGADVYIHGGETGDRVQREERKWKQEKVHTLSNNTVLNQLPDANTHCPNNWHCGASKSYGLQVKHNS